MNSSTTRVRIFFFQAEDGIRDADVTGVQTCALPISLLARHINVEPGQREPRQGVVVKLRPRPADSVVASGAGCREARRLVVRVRRVVVVGEVARGAGRRRPCGAAVDMALLARLAKGETG